MNSVGMNRTEQGVLIFCEFVQLRDLEVRTSYFCDKFELNYVVNIKTFLELQCVILFYLCFMFWYHKFLKEKVSVLQISGFTGSLIDMMNFQVYHAFIFEF